MVFLLSRRAGRERTAAHRGGNKRTRRIARRVSRRRLACGAGEISGRAATRFRRRARLSRRVGAFRRPSGGGRNESFRDERNGRYGKKSTSRRRAAHAHRRCETRAAFINHQLFAALERSENESTIVRISGRFVL